MHVRHIVQGCQTETITSQIVKHHAKSNIAGAEVLVFTGKVGGGFRQDFIIQQAAYPARTTVVRLDQKEGKQLVAFVLG